MQSSLEEIDNSIIERAKRLVEYFPAIFQSMNKATKLNEQQVCDKIKLDKKLHFQYFHMLQIINNSPNCSVNDIMKMLPLAQSTISQHLTKLLKDGFINITSDPIDRRKSNITITDKGYELLKERKEFAIRNQSYYLALLDEKDRELYEESFQNLAQIAHKINQIEKNINRGEK